MMLIPALELQIVVCAHDKSMSPKKHHGFSKYLSQIITLMEKRLRGSEALDSQRQATLQADKSEAAITSADLSYIKPNP